MMQRLTRKCVNGFPLRDTGDDAKPRKRSFRNAVEEVSAYLGNTPAACRASYIDPRVFDRFDAGVTVATTLERLPAADAADPVGRATSSGQSST